MNLPKIRFSRPSFSPRFFIYFLFGLVILVLLVEGGYFFYLQQKKVIEGKSQIILEEIQEDLREGKIAGDVVLFKGKVEKIEGRTVAMFAETSNFPVYINVDVPPDAVFFKSGDHAQKGEMLKGDYFNDIKVGSRIVFSDLLPGKENFFSSKKVIFEE